MASAAGIGKRKSHPALPPSIRTFSFLRVARLLTSDENAERHKKRTSGGARPRRSVKTPRRCVVGIPQTQTQSQSKTCTRWYRVRGRSAGGVICSRIRPVSYRRLRVPVPVPVPVRVRVAITIRSRASRYHVTYVSNRLGTLHVDDVDANANANAVFYSSISL